MSKLNKFDKLIWIVGGIAAVGLMSHAFYVQKTHQWHVEAVMDGAIHGDKEGRIYHVPTCPEYQSVQGH